MHVVNGTLLLRYVILGYFLKERVQRVLRFKSDSETDASQSQEQFCHKDVLFKMHSNRMSSMHFNRNT